MKLHTDKARNNNRNDGMFSRVHVIILYRYVYALKGRIMDCSAAKSCLMERTLVAVQSRSLYLYIIHNIYKLIHKKHNVCVRVL